MTIIEARNVEKLYRRGGVWGGGSVVRAVDGASLTIAAGTCLALVGPSGSGKSTLGRMVLGLEAPDAGEILYRGRNRRDLRGEEKLQARRAVQAVFQNSQGAVNPRFTARDVIGEPLVNFDRLSGPALRDRVASLLESVGLAAADMDKLPHQFSGGELQRICLARALAPKPDLVVLDEAVSSLDMVNQSRILALLARIRADLGTAFLFITHDLRVVSAIADRMAVMDAGQVAFTVDDIDRPTENLSDSNRELFRKLAEAVLPSQ